MSLWPWLVGADLERQRWTQTTTDLLTQNRVSLFVNVILAFNFHGNDLE
jgi:hypothetical protein